MIITFCFKLSIIFQFGKSGLVGRGELAYHGGYQTYILNKSSIVTTLCTLPEYSLRDNE